MERLIERGLFYSRWLLVPIYLGLAVSLLFFAVIFLKELATLATNVAEFGEKEAILTALSLTALSLIDLALVASLVVMVIISGYENFVSKLDVDSDDKLSWIGKLDAGTLKLKVASSIVAISSVHLLKAFMNAADTPNDKLLWLVVIHLTFVVSALAMALGDRLGGKA